MPGRRADGRLLEQRHGVREALELGNGAALRHVEQVGHAIRLFAHGEVVAVFGPTDPVVYAPFSPRAIALRGPHGLSTSEADVGRAVAASEQWLVQLH